MEDYKKILSRNLTPSLFILLTLLSSTILGYSLSLTTEIQGRESAVTWGPGNMYAPENFESLQEAANEDIYNTSRRPPDMHNNITGDIIVSLVLFAAALALLPAISMNSFHVPDTETRHTESSRATGPDPGAVALVHIKLIRSVLGLRKSKNVYLLLLITAILAWSNLKKISDYAAAGRDMNLHDEKKFYHGTVEQVKRGRYNSTATIKITAAGSTFPAAGSGSQIVAFLPLDSKLKTDDEIILYSGIKKINGGNDSREAAQYFRKGIRCFVSLRHSDYDILKASQPGLIDIIKEKISQGIHGLFSSDTGTLVTALYFGDQNVINKRDISRYKRAGVMHVLAASGFNVGILSLIPLFILGLLRINKKIILVVTMITIAIYLVLTDMQVSLFRACIMFAVYSAYAFFDLEKNIFNSFFIAGIVIILLFPYEIYTLGFQLSFGATYGILLLYALYRKSFSFLPGPAANSISVSLSAQVFVIPLIFMQMKELNLTGFLSNLLIIPIVSCIMIISIIALLLSLISMEIAMVPGVLADYAYKINSSLIDYLSGIDGHFFIDNCSPILLIPFCMLFIPLLPFKKNRLLSLAIPLAIALTWIMLCQDVDATNHVSVINHGKGKALLSYTGSRAILAGELPAISGVKKIVALMEKSNIRDMDIYITNPDFGNISSYSYLIKKRVVSQCGISPAFRIDKNLKEFFRLIDSEKIKLRVIDEDAKEADFVKKTGLNGPGGDHEQIVPLHLYHLMKKGKTVKELQKLAPEYHFDDMTL